MQSGDLLGGHLLHQSMVDALTSGLWFRRQKLPQSERIIHKFSLVFIRLPLLLILCPGAITTRLCVDFTWFSGLLE